jgi:hypothetical protein
LADGFSENAARSLSAAIDIRAPMRGTLQHTEVLARPIKATSWLPVGEWHREEGTGHGAAAAIGAAAATGAAAAATGGATAAATSGRADDPPAPCNLAGVWQSKNTQKYEIRQTAGASGSSSSTDLAMISLAPTDWLTATLSYVDVYRIRPSVRAVYDNGNSKYGSVSEDCSSIHWGVETPPAGTLRYAWASACNATDVTQMGWSLLSVSSLDPNDDTPYTLVKYTTPAFTGCLDRSRGWLSVAACTATMEQKWVIPC